MTLPDATSIFSDGDFRAFDLADGTWRNVTTGASGTVAKLPDMMLDIIASGGVMQRLVVQGYLPAASPRSGDCNRSEYHTTTQFVTRNPLQRSTFAVPSWQGAVGASGPRSRRRHPDAKSDSLCGALKAVRASIARPAEEI